MFVFYTLQQEPVLGGRGQKLKNKNTCGPRLYFNFLLYIKEPELSSASLKTLFCGPRFADPAYT